MFVCYILIAAADSVSVQEILKGDFYVTYLAWVSLDALGQLMKMNSNGSDIILMAIV